MGNVWDDVTCVLWFTISTRDGVDFDLCDDEEDAAWTAALYLSGETDATYDVHGVQFYDGRLIPTREWQALRDAVAARREKAAERRDNPPPPIVYRNARDPFTGEVTRVEEDTPPWVGAQP